MLLLENIQNTVTAINNNPLLKGGIPKDAETGPGAVTPRPDINRPGE
jgi:hypothetical protein